MASLPADRTKLALAQGNQVPNLVLASAKNINAIIEAYDTIDLLNQKVDTNYGTGAIGTNQLAANSVTLNQMADNSVGTTELVAASVTLPKMATNSVGTSQLIDGTVTGPKIAGGTITADKFVAGALNNDTQNGLNIVALQADVVQRTINVKSAPYNAKGDGVTDDTAAILAAIATNKNIFFPTGTYLISQTISLTSANTQSVKWTGAGSGNTTLKFTSAVTGYLIKRLDVNSAEFSIDGMAIKGAGIASGSSIVGFYSHRTDNASSSYNLRMNDVAVTDVSGSGFVVTDWFQQHWTGCYARNIGGNGFEIGGDQATVFTNSGSYNDNIIGYSWWFRNGYPTLTNLNTGMCGGGLKIGQASADPYGGAKYCFPSIFGLNIEGINVNNGIGILLNSGSNFGIAVGINIYAENATVLYGIYSDSLGKTGIICDVTYITVGTGTFTNKLYIYSAAASAGIISIGPTVAAVGGSASAVVQLIPNSTAGAFKIDAALTTKNGLTASRPSAVTVGAGAQYYDTTLNLPIWSDGTNWKNAAGTIV